MGGLPGSFVLTALLHERKQGAEGDALQASPGAQGVHACDSWGHCTLKTQLPGPPDTRRSQRNVDNGQFRENQFFKKRDEETSSFP